MSNLQVGKEVVFEDCWDSFVERLESVKDVWKQAEVRPFVFCYPDGWKSIYVPLSLFSRSPSGFVPRLGLLRTRDGWAEHAVMMSPEEAAEGRCCGDGYLQVPLREAWIECVCEGRLYSFPVSFGLLRSLTEWPVFAELVFRDSGVKLYSVYWQGGRIRLLDRREEGLGYCTFEEAWNLVGRRFAGKVGSGD